MEKHKCDYCNGNLVISSLIIEENKACLSCPDYIAGNDAHTSYVVELTEELEELFAGDKTVLYW